jgi:hypothetical protein
LSPPENAWVVPEREDIGLGSVKRYKLSGE